MLACALSNGCLAARRSQPRCCFRVMLHAEAASVRRGDLCAHSQANSYFICLCTRPPSDGARAEHRYGEATGPPAQPASLRRSLENPKTPRTVCKKFRPRIDTRRACASKLAASTPSTHCNASKKLRRRTRAGKQRFLAANLLAAQQHPPRRRQDARPAAAAAHDGAGIEPPLLRAPDRDRHAGL